MLRFTIAEPAPTEVLTVNEVADYLKVRPVTIYRMVRAKRIPFVRPEGTARIIFVKHLIDECLQKEGTQ